ncbi:MAG: hypothetical protein ACLPID_07890 [Beijerinckiaceae bacterium]
MTLRSITMVRLVSILGLFVGCAIVAIAMAGTPRSGDVEAHENDTSARTENCRVEEIPLDEGYGVSRKELRRICTTAD